MKLEAKTLIVWLFDDDDYEITCVFRRCFLFINILFCVYNIHMDGWIDEWMLLHYSWSIIMFDVIIMMLMMVIIILFIHFTFIMKKNRQRSLIFFFFFKQQNITDINRLIVINYFFGFQWKCRKERERENWKWKRRKFKYE